MSDTTQPDPETIIDWKRPPQPGDIVQWFEREPGEGLLLVLTEAYPVERKQALKPLDNKTARQASYDPTIWKSFETLDIISQTKSTQYIHKHYGYPGLWFRLISRLDRPQNQKGA